MNTESRIAIAIVLAAAIIGAAVMIRDANITGLAAGGTNLPPTYVASSTKYAMAINQPLTLNLNALFSDPEGQKLTFIATQSKDLGVEISGDRLVITPAPGFSGERIATVIASDGTQTASKRLKIEVGSAPVQPPSEPEFVPAAPPAQAPPEPPGQAKKPEIEEALEEALDTASEVPAIIVLKKSEGFGTLAERGRFRKEALEERRRLAKEAREAFKDAQEAAAITGAAVLGTNGLTVVHEYDTVNAIAVRLTRQALNKLKNEGTIAKILLDRELTTGLADSVPLIDADDVWNLTAGSVNVTGQNETICILDTGIDVTHPAFAGKIVGGYDYVNEDSDPQDDSSNSHGTHVAGIAAGNSSAVRGVARDAKIVPVKVCNSANSCTASDILAGIDYCNNNSVAFNISVMSISIGDNSQYNSTTCPTLFDDALNTSVSLGIVTAVASGNNGFTAGISYPACSPYVISVGSTTKSDTMSSFTNRGGDRLDVLAPGSSITSSVIGGGTGSLSGTSMATPHASGAIALVQQNQKAQVKPPLSLAEMRSLLKETGKLVDSWNRIDPLNAIVQMNHNLTINLTENSVTNRTPPKAVVRFKDSTDFSEIIDCTKLRHNFVEVDSVACPEYNKSARIVFEGLPGINATPLRNGEPCPAEICQNITFSGGTLEFDVTSFTNFSSESNFSTQDVITNCNPGPVVMNSSTTLTNSISSNGTCIVTNATNIVLDCAGFTIGFNANGSGSVAEAGINLTHASGVTIRNCIITDLNNTGSIGDAGILFDTSNYSTANNVTITANSSSAVYFSGSHNITLANSTFVNGGLNDGPALRESNITNNFLNVSSISLTGTGNVIAFNNFISNASTIIQQSGNASILFNNATIRTSVNSPRGIDTDPAGPFDITGNRIFVHTTGTAPNAFRFASSSGNITNNTFLANGTGATAVSIQASATGTFVGNNFTVMGASSAAIEFLFAVVNTTRFTDTIISSEASFIDINGDTATSVINFTNTTFVMPDGSINIIGRAQLNGSKNVTVRRLNITSNRAFLNSSNLSFLNQTGIVTLNGITAVDPRPQVAFDDATFADCTPTADPFCTEISYSGGVFVFNTSHFTSFQSTDAATLSACATVNTSSILTQNVTTAGNCITFGADNVDLNCNGFNITYGTGGSDEVFGINISNRNNITVRNCGIFKGSALGARTYGIAFLNSSNGTLVNNFIRTNGTEENDGIHTGLPSSVNVTFTPATVNIVTNDGNINNPFCTNATGVSLCQVCFDTAGVNCAFPGQTGCSDGEGFKFDDILRFNLSNNTNVASGNIQVIGGETVFCNLNANTTISFSTRNNCGSFRSATFSGTFFAPGAENNLTCAVAGGGKDEDNGFKLVSFSYEGTTITPGLTVTGNATALNATGNTIIADGGPNTRGIYADASGSIIASNVIITAGGNESHGILLGGENTTVANNNILTADGGKSRGIVTVSRFSNVTNNIVSITGPSDEREGILVLGNNTRVTFNNITTLSGRLSHGIHILSVFFANITGNNISVGAGNGSHGILLAAGSADVALNNVSVNTSSLSHGISLSGSIATGNTITGNTIRVNSRGSNALNLVTASGNTLSNNNIILANQSSAYLDRALGNTFVSSTLPLFGSSLFILQDNGTINYTQALNISASTLLSQVISIAHNATFVNATHPGGSQLNGTAVLRFFSLPGDGVIPVFDDADDGTFDVCAGGRCRNASYNQSTGILQYNVTHFTTYAAQEVSACATIDNLENATTVNVTLTNNVTSTIDCFTIVAENVTFNCQGNPIFYDSTGLGGDGIQVEHTNNVIVRDCILTDISFGGAGGIGINITNSSNVTLINNTIKTNGTSGNDGIAVKVFNATTHTNFTFTNNTVRARGSLNNNTGIHFTGGNATGIVIVNNTIDTNGTDGNDGIRFAPLFSGNGFRGVRAVQNTIVTNGTFRNNGIYSGTQNGGATGNIHHVFLANNTIRTFGTSTINNGIYLLGNAINITVMQNNISVNTTSASSSGIFFETFNFLSVIENNTIHNNSIRTRAGSGSGIGIELQDFLGARLRNHTVTYNDIITNGTSTNYGMEITGAVNAVIENNTVISGGSSTGNEGMLIAISFANITIHNNLINTTGAGSGHGITAAYGLTPTNITITRNNITTGNRPGGTIIGSNNRGINLYSVTNSLVLDNFVYTNGTYNNTGIFVGASSTHNTISNNTIVTGGNEGQNTGIALVQVVGDFGEIASNNVTNNTINSTAFGQSPSFGIGILLQGIGNSGTVNNNIVRINTVHARGNDSDNYGIHLVGLVQYNNITNNQILTNGTDRNYGIFAFSPSTSFQTTDNIIEWNNITAWGIASTDNYGIFLHNLVIRHNITDNNVTTRGSDRNHGLFINASSSNNLVERNNFTLQTTGTDNIGAVIQGSANNTLRNNFIQTNISPLDKGVVLRSFARSNIVSNNTVRTRGTVLTLSLSETNVVQDQNASAVAAAGALLMAGSPRNNFTNVILASDTGIAAEFLPSAGVGTFFDGFEDGTIPPFTTSGNAPWLINNTNASSGTFSAQAADINDSQSATLTLALPAGQGSISFARQVSSESGFDFLTFAIDGVNQQQWSGSLPYATFNFTFASANTFTWTYSKDSSLSTGLDTAWVDNINISFAGNGSLNNTFNRLFFITNNTWLFLGENNTNNTLDNTTFIGQNGTINILPFVHVPENSNATLSRLNNTHNLSFLNSAALGYLNTTAILRFLQILFIDPAPFRDLEDDGTFAYCPPSRCAELAYIDNQFIYNTSGFSFYAVAEGQVNLSINKTDSQDPIPVSTQLNYTIRVNNSGSSTAFNLTLLEIYPPEVIFLTAQPTPEAGTNNTFFLGNLTPESQIVLNITVFVRNVTADIFINNTVNATFLNQSNATIRANVTESTQVANPAVLNMSTISIAKTGTPDPVNTSSALTYVINVTGTGPGIARNVTVNDTYPPQVIFQTAQPTPVTGTNNTFFLGNITNGTSVLINITVLVLNITNGTVINNSANVTFQNNTNFTFTALATASTTVTNDTPVTPPAPATGGGGGGGGYTTPTPRSVFPQQEQPAPEACIESWACEGWSECSDGAQLRTCVDLSQCNTTNYLPVTKRACEMFLPEVIQPEPEPLVLPELQPEPSEPEVEVPRWTLCTVLPIAIDAMLVFLAALTIILIFLTKEQRQKSHLKRAADIAGVITLVLLLAHYVACGSFLPWQVIAFLILSGFLLLMQLSELLGGKKVVPATDTRFEKPAIPKPAALPKPAAAKKAVSAARPAPTHEPAHDEADLKDVFKALDRSTKVLEKFRQTIKKNRK